MPTVKTQAGRVKHRYAVRLIVIGRGDDILERPGYDSEPLWVYAVNEQQAQLKVTERIRNKYKGRRSLLIRNVRVEKKEEPVKQPATLF